MLSTPKFFHIVKVMSAGTGSSGKKSVMKELLTSRGSSHFEDAVISAMFGVSVALGSISRSQEVLLDKIELIVQKMETLQKEVSVLQKDVKESLEMNSLSSFEMPSSQEMEEFFNFPTPIQEVGTTPDITCYETISLPSSQE